MMVIASLNGDASLHKTVVEVITTCYPSKPIMDTDEHRKYVLTMQNGLNGMRIADRILEATHTRWLMKSDLHLRAARPDIEGQESVTWHRESFYGCPTSTLNIWMPVINCTPENSVRYVPGSEEIPDERILVTSEADPSVTKGSDGSKIGLLYAPKQIIGGVDFSTIKTLNVPYGMVAIFSGQLIHGAAINKTSGVRFSIDFRIIPKRTT